MPTRKRRWVGTGDPLLKGRDWRKVRAYWRSLRRPCARCGRQIDYSPGATGPASLCVGHIVGRDEARAMGWTKAEINALTNTQPECALCSARSGVLYAHAKRAAGRPRPLESGEW